MKMKTTIAARGGKYTGTTNWQSYQPFLPEVFRLTEKNLPREEYWDWDGTKVHIDRYESEGEARCKVILVHGGGGNGRVLSPISVALRGMPCTVIAPDLPGYGLTVPDKKKPVEYGHWVSLLSDLVERERVPGVPIYLFGLSIGGMLAYHTAALNGKVGGLIATTLVDMRLQKVRDAVSANLFLSRVGLPLGSWLRRLTDGIHVPIRWLSKMELITNDPEFSAVFAHDPLAGGSKVRLGFLRTLMNYTPVTEAENFKVCPVLLVHPGNDPWTPLALSAEFFQKIPAPKKMVELENAGHLPYELPGREQLMDAVTGFLDLASQPQSPVK